MPKAKPKKKEPEKKKVFKVNWLNAAPFLMKPMLWQLLSVSTDKKGKMIATLEAR